MELEKITKPHIVVKCKGRNAWIAHVYRPGRYEGFVRRAITHGKRAGPTKWRRIRDLCEQKP